MLHIENRHQFSDIFFVGANPATQLSSSKDKQNSILLVVVNLEESGWFELAVPSVHVYWNILPICNNFIPHPKLKDVKMGDQS